MVSEGKALATSYECKFIETSVGINHNVDELLVGLLTQIRLKQQHAAARAERQRKRNGSRKTRNRARSPKEIEEPPPPPASAASTPRKRTRLSASVKVRGLLGRVWARDSKSKSCENLHVL
ncbi:Ras family protein [Operophtera brumata]|uniref:Ras family protein n=1 Tax=Operophtera brumata TaxID=104452 RepID=A0A0L7L4Q2_OPEBR|nr:Ras family protein [Operophtera brumata]